MADAAPRPLSLTSLRGGLDDNTPPHELAPDACTIAENVEWHESSIGERRRGCEGIDLTGSGLDAEAEVVHITQWFPDGGTTTPEWFVIATTPGVSVSVARRDTAGSWHVVAAADPILSASPNIYAISSQPLNGKLFLAYPSAKDRTHVWDGTALRTTGLAQPNPPTAANTGAGTFSHTRYYRVRYVIRNGSGKVLVRSEPSTVLIFNPSGGGSAARITRPALLSESETDWEVEASFDNANFYRIATVAAATTTYDDSVSGKNTITTIPSGLSIPQGYVQLSDRAQTLNMTGTISNGAYSNGVSFPTRGWVMYTSAGVYIPEGWIGHIPPVAGDVSFASQDIALALEGAVGDGQTYADVGVLSEDIGSYLTQPNVRFLGAVDDRLTLGGHFSDVTRMSSVYWTPVHNDPGAGNDERLPLIVNNSLSLDNGFGGPVTGIIPGVSGPWYVFKYEHIYKMNPTRDVQRAYAALTISTMRGAVEGSVFPGLDQAGIACIYFQDPHVGPFILGGGGMQQILGLRNTWKRMNLAAAKIISRGCFYQFKEQAHWWVAVDGSDVPNLKMVLQVNEIREASPGCVARGWSFALGHITDALSVGLLSEAVTEGGVTTLRKRPFIGFGASGGLQRCDAVGVVTDAGVPYIARVRSRPFIAVGLLNKFGGMVGSLLAKAVADSNIVVRLIRDFGKEQKDVSTSLSPVAAETSVVKLLDNLSLSEATTIQVEFADE